MAGEVSARLGSRIHVTGLSCSGKSTLGAELAAQLDAPCVELDALNWEANWFSVCAHDPDEFVRRLREATSGESWVVAGSYERFSQRAFWDRLETVVWLDLPMVQLIVRMLVRSWRRWRTGELLWGTNRDRFWHHLMLWKGEESLLWWIVTQYRRRQRRLLACMTDPRWRHLRFVRIVSSAELEAFRAALTSPAEAQLNHD